MRVKWLRALNFPPGNQGLKVDYINLLLFFLKNDFT